MKVTFVYPDLSLKSQRKFYHGIAFLSGVLKRAGHQTSLIHIFEPIGEPEFINLIVKKSPDLVAFSTTTNMFEVTLKYVRLIKKHFSMPVICGGIHPTILPDEVINCDEIDMICIGEGEFALLELCDKIDKKEDIRNILNIWVKQDGRIYKNTLRPLIQDLDRLPFPDRDIYNQESLEDARLKRAVFMVSRGCPYACSYCCNHKIANIYGDKYVRFRSVNNVLDEIELVIKKHSVKYITFHDDIFTQDKKWLKEFGLKYNKKINLPFICNSRVNLLDKEVISILKNANCQGINMGIESGNDYIRQQILNRNITREQIIKAFRLCKEFGIKATSYNMVGLPFEDMEKIWDTINLNAEIMPQYIQTSIFYPYPGTDLYNLCVQNRFLSNIKVNNYFERSTLSQPTITSRQVDYAFHNFEFMVALYSVVNKFTDIVKTKIDRFIQKLFFTNSPIISICARIHALWKDVIHYYCSIIIYYKEYGLKYVLQKIIRKLF